MNIIEKARIFATAAHYAIDQRRKYTNEPYINHPEEVVNILTSIGYTDESMLAAAWLHDVVEDTAITIEVIESEFGTEVSNLVSGLTDVSKPEDGNRATRKAIDREHTAAQNSKCQTIKCADLISNTSSIVERDPKFAKVYIEEKLLLLEVMANADDEAWLIAYEQCMEYYK